MAINKPIFLRQLHITKDLNNDKRSAFRISSIHCDWKTQTIIDTELKSISLIGKIARIRKQGSKMCFILLRDGITSIQILFQENKNSGVTREYIKNIAKYNPESVVKITGNIVASPCIIDSSTLKHWEMRGFTIEKISISEVVPLQVYKPDAGLDTRLNNRWLDIRNMRNQLIFKIQHNILTRIQEDLNDSGFIQIFTPKIMEGVAESGSEVFKLNYFDNIASLAQSPQLFKQMAINGGLGQVYEIGPVFRAEKSNGSRHLTQYTSIDIEMEFVEHYHQVINTLYQLLLNSCYLSPEMETSWEEFNPDYDALIFSENPIIIPYNECVKMLKTSKYGCQKPEDLNHKDEFNLGLIVKEKYESDLFVIDQYPKNIRPFYTYVNEDDTTRSYDFILRGCEILSGSQRINDHKTLIESAKNHLGEDKICSISSYLESFKYGSPPHAGGAFGLERLISRILCIENVREVSLFPRDPTRLNP